MVLYNYSYYQVYKLETLLLMENIVTEKTSAAALLKLFLLR